MVTTKTQIARISYIHEQYSTLQNRVTDSRLLCAFYCNFYDSYLPNTVQTHLHTQKTYFLLYDILLQTNIIYLCSFWYQIEDTSLQFTVQYLYTITQYTRYTLLLLQQRHNCNTVHHKLYILNQVTVQYQYTIMQYNTNLLYRTTANMYIVYTCIYTHRSSHIICTYT